jgi:hypothetical protein
MKLFLIFFNQLLLEELNYFIFEQHSIALIFIIQLSFNFVVISTNYLNFKVHHNDFLMK